MVTSRSRRPGRRGEQLVQGVLRGVEGCAGTEDGVMAVRVELVVRRCLKRVVDRQLFKLLERCDRPGVEVLAAA